MKIAMNILCCVICITLETLLHIVSFNIFSDATFVHYSTMLVVTALQMFLLFILVKRKATISFLLFFFVFLLSSLYDVWTIILELQSKVSRSFDVILIVAFAIDLFLSSLTLVLFCKEKHKHGAQKPAVNEK